MSLLIERRRRRRGGSLYRSRGSISGHFLLRRPYAAAPVKDQSQGDDYERGERQRGFPRCASRLTPEIACGEAESPQVERSRSAQPGLAVREVDRRASRFAVGVLDSGERNSLPAFQDNRTPLARRRFRQIILVEQISGEQRAVSGANFD